MSACEYIKRYSHRVRNLHLKDRLPGSTPESCVLGKGMLPIEGICRVGKEAGVEWLLVKQEQYQDASPLAAMEQSAAFLKSVLAQMA